MDQRLTGLPIARFNPLKFFPEISENFCADPRFFAVSGYAIRMITPGKSGFCSAELFIRLASRRFTARQLLFEPCDLTLVAVDRIAERVFGVLQGDFTFSQFESHFTFAPPSRLVHHIHAKQKKQEDRQSGERVGRPLGSLFAEALDRRGRAVTIQ